MKKILHNILFLMMVVEVLTLPLIGLSKNMPHKILTILLLSDLVALVITYFLLNIVTDWRYE